MTSNLRWPLAVGGFALGSGATLCTQSFLAGVKIPDGAGALIGGCAAVMSAALAWQGFTRWETRHRKERRAEIAGEALVASLNLCSALERVAKQEDSNPEQGHYEQEDFEFWQKLLWEPSVCDPFTKARTRVEAYFPDVVGRSLESLWQLRNDFDQHVSVACRVCDGGFLPKEQWKEFNDEHKQLGRRLNASRTELKKRLQPYALIDDAGPPEAP